MARINKGFWIWLTFSEKDNSYLEELQRKVQLILKSPLFKPHLTLYGPFASLSDELLLFIKKVANKEKTFKLLTNKYGKKNEFFESFFIKVKASQKLIDLRKEFLRFENKQNEFSYHPHISLAYGKFENRFKDDLLLTVPEVKKKLHIAKFSIVKVDEKKFIWDEVMTFPFETKN